MGTEKTDVTKGSKKQMARGLWFTAPRVAELLEEEVPQPGPGEITVAAECSLVSAGSEMRLYRGDGGGTTMLPTSAGTFPFPIKFAYEIAGRVEAVGEGSGYEVGDRVYAVYPHQERFTVNTAFCMKVPAEMTDLRRSVFMGQLVHGLYALHDVPIRPGQFVAVSGLGLIGSFCAFMARKMAWKLILVDPIPRRRDIAEYVGADAVVDPKDAAAVIKELTKGQGVDIFIEASGAPPALQTAINSTGVEGTICVVSWYGRNAVPLKLSPEFHLRRQQMVSIMGPFKHFRDPERIKGVAMDIMTHFDVQPLITHEIPFDRAPEAYAQIDQHPDETLGVVLTYSHD